MDRNCNGHGMPPPGIRVARRSPSKMVSRGARALGCVALIVALATLLPTAGHATVYPGFITNLVTDGLTLRSLVPLAGVLLGLVAIEQVRRNQERGL